MPQLVRVALFLGYNAQDPTLEAECCSRPTLFVPIIVKMLPFLAWVVPPESLVGVRFAICWVNAHLLTTIVGAVGVLGLVAVAVARVQDIPAEEGRGTAGARWCRRRHEFGLAAATADSVGRLDGGAGSLVDTGGWPTLVGVNLA